MNALARSLVGSAFALILIALPTAALSQVFPSKPIRVVVPFPPGGVDVTLRLMQPELGAAVAD